MHSNKWCMLYKFCHENVAFSKLILNVQTCIPTNPQDIYCKTVIHSHNVIITYLSVYHWYLDITFQ